MYRNRVGFGYEIKLSHSDLYSYLMGMALFVVEYEEDLTILINAS